MSSRALSCLAAATLAGGLTVGLAAPAYAGCYGTRADKPVLVTPSTGPRLVTGYGGGSLCPGSATVCLDRNVSTVTSTCRYYTGSNPVGSTGSTPCQVGVWQTYVVITPSDGGAPHVLHSDPLVLTPLDCSPVVTA